MSSGIYFSTFRGVSSILLSLYFAHCAAFHGPLLHIAEDLAPRVRRQQQLATIPVKGASPVFGVQSRLEIRQLQQDVDQFNLYLLGLQKMQAVNQSDPMSWYQIAGIHGMPYIPWDDVQAAPGQDDNGYCAHYSTLFLTWHRPYLALFEQVLYEKVTEAANEFPTGALRQRYAQAAMSFRIPYWDWAAEPPDGGPVLPDCVTSPKVNVTVPSHDNATTVITEISNPLYSYVFHPLVPSDFMYDPDLVQFTLYPQTLRAPSSTNANATSDERASASAMANAQSNLQDRVYNLMTSSKNYTTVCTEMWYDENDDTGFDSIEAVHDVIHNNVGLSGHMTYLQYSAFDPVFWLHHAMVDRLFALWQVINPESFIEPAVQWQPTFTYAANTTEDGNSRLTPFHSDTTGDFWTSFASRDVKKFSYTYPELWNNDTNLSASISDIQAAVNNMYGRSSAASSLYSKSLSRFHSEERGTEASPTTEEASLANATTSTGARRQYITTIRADKMGLGDSFSVYVFVGPFNDGDSSGWRSEPNLVGTHGFFANLGGMKTEVPLMASGTVPLTSALADKVESDELSGLGVEEVSIYLRQNLSWRVMKADGCVVSSNDVPRLTVGVVSADVQPAPTMDRFPTWGPFTSHPNITEGMAGGLCTGEPVSGTSAGQG
ncbi:Di-copper centre-containing protein [Viridothelium virens]|uniref:tyrosinase n=1 Tax=Viridothelium virens TaxID=1048519 RepID=A0A6A6H9P3_VIRVR|nr:Di-copper centre-containing protein [Viridothelium virens]